MSAGTVRIAVAKKWQKTEFAVSSFVSPFHLRPLNIPMSTRMMASDAGDSQRTRAVG
jgi:hypothetical protein